MGVTPAELWTRYPQLFHMATRGAWPSISEHGLLPTSTLVSSSGLPRSEQDVLLQSIRPSSTAIEHPVVGTVNVRDQAPLRLAFLEESLTDMSIQEWLDLLNGRVFFWLHPDRLTRLLSARNYKNSEHDVITLDTQSLISAYGAKVVLSPINSGATLFPRARPRGSGTFTKLADYPDEKWRIRADATAVAELAVIGGVPDIATFVVSVDRYQGPVRKSTLFKP